jgi:hypothetical protein
MDVANFLKKQTYFPEIIIKHEHPGSNPSIVFDETYTRNHVFYYEDEALYKKRAVKFKKWSPPKVSIKIR